jgi:hypothetical protein
MVSALTQLIRSRPAPGAGGGGDVLPNYWNPQRLDPEIILPSSYLGASVVFGAGAWGAWATVEPATAADYVLAMAHLSKVIANTGSLWLEIAIGPAGSEFPVAIVGAHGFIAGSGAFPIITRPYRLEPIFIPAGSRVAARGYSNVGHPGSVVQLTVIPPSPTATWYSPWSNLYIGGGRATNLRRFPAVPNWVSINGSGGAWVTVIAAAANTLLLNAAEFDPLNAGGGASNVVEVAVGAAGSEQVLSRISIGTAVILAFCEGYSEAARKGIIFAGERVSARLVRAFVGPWRMAFYCEDI